MQIILHHHNEWKEQTNIHEVLKQNTPVMRICVSDGGVVIRRQKIYYTGHAQL